jgi:3-deoxy-manno-octulosonate cytidylyltransferase (CMP-KDO synthetase)
MVLHCARNAVLALGHSKVVVATDDTGIHRLVEDKGYNAIKIASTCINGTERVAAVSKILDADVYLNLQGDEPMLHFSSIHRVGFAKMQHPNSVICGMCQIGADEDPDDETIVKVQFENGSDLLAMSRKPISDTYKQVGIYAYNKTELDTYMQVRNSWLERKEGIEILRFLETDINVKMVEVHNSLSVDLREHIQRVEERMETDGLK